MARICVQCGHEWPDDFTFCPVCGGELDVLSSELYCPCCGKAYDHGKFCPDCGVKLEERSLKKESSSGVVVSPEESSSSIECPACGFQNVAGATVCANCGFPLESDTSIDSVSGTSTETSSEDDAILAKYSDEYGDMRDLNDEEAPLAIEEIRRLAEKGNPQAECFLGYLYVDGKYMEQDSKKAYDLICDAERKGYELASAYKGIFYMQGLVVEQDLKEAERLFDAALHIPGVMFLKGMLCTMRDDMTESIKWVKMAAEKGDDAGLCYMGHAYMNGIGDTPQDPVKAFEYYNESAALGNPEAENMLGVCYQNGQGTEPNDEQALYWYQEAVKHNDSDAQNNLANCYKYGSLGLEEDPEKAFELYKKAAEQDNVDAMFEVAEYYNTSYLTSKKSVEWYQKAADAGHGGAMFELAQKYENGWDVEKDPSKAEEYYVKAMEAGDERAIARIEKKDESVTEDCARPTSSIVSSFYQFQYSGSYLPYSSGGFATGDIFKSMPGGDLLSRSEPLKSIEFTKIWYEDWEGKCMVIHADFTIDNALNQNGRLHAWFNYLDGSKFLAPSWETVRRAPDGQLCVSDAIKSTYESALWTDFRLVLPYEDFNLSSEGIYKLKFQLGAVFGKEHLPYSDFVEFSISVTKSLLRKRIKVL